MGIYCFLMKVNNRNKTCVCVRESEKESERVGDLERVRERGREMKILNGRRALL